MLFWRKLWSFSLGQIWPFEGLLCGPSFFMCMPQNTINAGLSTFLTKWDTKFWGVIIWTKLAAFTLHPIWPRWKTLLGPENDPSKCYCFALSCFQKCRYMYVYSVSWTSTLFSHPVQQTIPSQFEKQHKLLKITVLLQPPPPISPKIGVLEVVCLLKVINFDEAQLKKTKTPPPKKWIWMTKQDRKPQNRKYWWTKCPIK